MSAISGLVAAAENEPQLSDVSRERMKSAEQKKITLESNSQSSMGTGMRQTYPLPQSLVPAARGG